MRMAGLRMNGINYLLTVNACSVNSVKKNDKYIRRTGYAYLKKSR